MQKQICLARDKGFIKVGKVGPRTIAGSDDPIQQCYVYYADLRHEMDQWLKQSVRLDPPGPNQGGEDEANYALAWFDHYLVTGSTDVLDHCQNLKLALSGWVDRECFHGYEPVAEAHHGPEPFLLFLPRYIGLVPDDQEAVSLLLDAAEHIGNWVDSIPDWYDYNRDVFHSFFIGTQEVREDGKNSYELAEHFRFIHLALAAYKVSTDQRYLDWSIRYGRKRAARILSWPEIPLLWDLDGNALSPTQVNQLGLHSLANSHHHHSGNRLGGIENLLASGAVYALGDLYLLSGDPIFQQATRKIVEPLIPTLVDPYNDPGAAVISYYRITFQDSSFDPLIETQIGKFPDSPPDQLALIFPERRKIRGLGVGKRADMALWGEWSEDGSVIPIQEPSTATLSLAYELTDDPVYAMRAFKSAVTRLSIARRVLRGGREHADMGSAICSVAAGHGRNWGTGAVTGCYGKLLLGLSLDQGQLNSVIEIRQSSGGKLIPPQLLSLVQLKFCRQYRIVFYNGSNIDLSFAWRLVNPSSNWEEVNLSVGEIIICSNQ